MTLSYIKRLGYWTQKIDKSLLKTFKMVIAGFQVLDKLGKVQFFQKTFLLADINVDVVLWIPFFTYSNTDIQFNKWELI